MKLCTFQVSTRVGRFERIGLVWPEKGILDLNFACAWHLAERGEPQPQRLADAVLPSLMLQFLAGGKPSMDMARAAESFAKSFDALPLGPNGETLLYGFEEVKLLAPVPKPPSLRVFSAFEAPVRRSFERLREPMPAAWYEMPVYVAGGHNHVIGTETDARWPAFTEEFDYELGLAVVVGKSGANVTLDDARSYIAGFTVINDFRARDIERRETSVHVGPAKAKNWCTALGPWLVTPDEIVDPYSLHMTARINGELWSDANSSSIYWTFEQMIALLTREDAIRPGDVLGSGAVGKGSGRELNRWVQPGDVIELEIEKVGLLRNRVVRKSAESGPLGSS